MAINTEHFCRVAQPLLPFLSRGLECSAVCRQSTCCAPQSRLSLALPLSLIQANKSSLLSAERLDDKRLIKTPSVVKFNRSGLGIIVD